MKWLLSTLIGIIHLSMMATPVHADTMYPQLTKIVPTIEITERVIIKTREKQLAKAQNKNKQERSRKKSDPVHSAQ